MPVRFSALLLLWSRAAVVLGLRYSGAQDDAVEAVAGTTANASADGPHPPWRWVPGPPTPWHPDQAPYVDLAAWSHILEAPSGDTSVPPRLWQLWEQGKDAPKSPLNEQCLAHWESLNKNWNRTLLDRSSVHDMFPELSALFERNPRTVQARCDMVRLAALAAHGGVWADASVLPLVPLDSFVQQLAGPSGFWAWAFKPYEDGHVASWFMAAAPNNPLVVRWRDAFMDRWKHRRFFNYYEVHHTLLDLVRKDSVVRSVWARTLKVQETWPQQCIGGCNGFWDTKPSERPPMLKRPFQGAGNPSEEWWAGYRAAVGS